uniref:Uncharacterized protein n=1 Tax=Oryzias latipes TaxID=8090 RepID=A0A3B3HZM4_ORYLA
YLLITLALQPLKLAEGGGGVLVEAAGDGLGLLRLAKQDCVTPEYHRHVLDLVSVDPSQDFGAVWVRCTARDSVQRDQCGILCLVREKPRHMGAQEGNQTCDLLIRDRLLYLYTTVFFNGFLLVSATLACLNPFLSHHGFRGLFGFSQFSFRFFS